MWGAGRHNTDARRAAPEHPAWVFRRSTSGINSRVECQRVAPTIQGLNSSSPTPCRSLLLFSPEATASIFSKISAPTASSDAPSSTRPASTSMSFCIFWYSALLLATLMLGEGLQPKHEPRPVVNTTRVQPEATWPVTEMGSYPG